MFAHNFDLNGLTSDALKLVSMLLKTVISLFVAIFIVVSSIVPAESTKGIYPPKRTWPIQFWSLHLYGPYKLLVERVGGDVQVLFNYSKLVNDYANRFWLIQSPPNAKGLSIAVGVRPGKKVRIWCEAVDGSIPATTLRSLEKYLSRIPPIRLQKGPVAFVLLVRLFDKHPASFPEHPRAWRAVIKKPMINTAPEEIFKVVWPD